MCVCVASIPLMLIKFGHLPTLSVSVDAVKFGCLLILYLIFVSVEVLSCLRVCVYCTLTYSYTNCYGDQ